MRAESANPFQQAQMPTLAANACGRMPGSLIGLDQLSMMVWPIYPNERLAPCLDFARPLLGVRRANSRPTMRFGNFVDERQFDHQVQHECEVRDTGKALPHLPLGFGVHVPFLNVHERFPDVNEFLTEDSVQAADRGDCRFRGSEGLRRLQPSVLESFKIF
jgi:hypothetical protein